MARPGSGLLVPVNGLGYPPQNMARVVVWEWLNEHGRWRPYSAAVCHHIENVLKGDARGSVVLGQVDGQLSPYVIDLQSMHQFRQDTGKRNTRTETQSLPIPQTLCNIPGDVYSLECSAWSCADKPKDINYDKYDVNMKTEEG